MLKIFILIMGIITIGSGLFLVMYMFIDEAFFWISHWKKRRKDKIKREEK